jgi:hypothetical protein
MGRWERLPACPVFSSISPAVVVAVAANRATQHPPPHPDPAPVYPLMSFYAPPYQVVRGQSRLRSSACAMTVWVACSCLSGG